MFDGIRRFIDQQKQKSRERLLPESKFIVEVTESEIINTRPEGVIERVTFTDLQSVVIETNDTGPLGTDLWWILVGKVAASGCAFPGGATGEQQVIEALQQLPGFRFKQFTNAMSSTENAKFFCWEAEPNPRLNSESA